MTDETPQEWKELTSVWQIDTATASIDEIKQRLRRERQQMLVMIGAEMLALAMGMASAIWLAIYTPFVYLAAMTGVCSGVTAAIALHLRRQEVPAAAEDVLRTLAAAITHEEHIGAQLRLGRAISFAALFVIGMVAATQLRNLNHTGASAFTAVTAVSVGGLYATTTLIWNLLLTGRMRKRKARLIALSAQLKGETL